MSQPASRVKLSHYPKSLHNPPYQTLGCRPQVQMSGFSKVEMSAPRPQWRMPETVALTMGELDRLQVMSQLAERRLTRRRAAALLGLSERQIRRLYRAFRRAGAAGLASRRRGRPSNRRLPDATRDRALALIRERYADFGPTFGLQKLTEAHGLTLSVETLRGWMIAAGLWVPRTQRTRRSYPPRPRRACRGELA